MTRFLADPYTPSELPIKDAANSRLGKKLASMFTIAKSSLNQVNDSSEVKN